MFKVSTHLFPKYFICFLTLLSFTTTATAQKEQKIYYDSTWKVTTPSNASYYRIYKVDEAGKPVGIVRDYYWTGKLQWEGYMSYIDKYDSKDDIDEGLGTWYHPNGTKSKEAYFVNDKLHGISRIWDEDGLLIEESRYVMGELEGRYITYHRNGKLSGDYNFSKGKMQGTQREYYENGKLKRQFEASNDMKEGLSTWYHENGKKQEESYYVNNKLHGISKVWDADGLLIVECRYFMDELDGRYISYYKNGKIKSSLNFVKGKKHGSQRDNFENGNLKVQFEYNNGKLLNGWFISCDEKGRCSDEFADEFLDRTNPNGWGLSNNTNTISKITNNGLSVKNTSGGPFAVWLPVNLNYSKRFTLVTKFSFKEANESASSGIIWNFKDWNNYCYISFDNTKFFKVGFLKDGKENFAFRGEATSESINTLAVTFDGKDLKFILNGRAYTIDQFDHEQAMPFNNIDLLSIPGKQLGLFTNGRNGETDFKYFGILKEM